MESEIILGYSDCFVVDAPLEIADYLQGISRKDLLKVASMFLARHHGSVYDYFSSYFNAKNNKYINDLWNDLSKRRHDLNKCIITNTQSSLRFFEYVYDNIECTDTVLKEEEIEVRILKAYLLFNDLIIRNQDKALHSVMKIEDDLKRVKAFFLTTTFEYYDIVNYTYKNELSTQIIKANYLYDFLSTQVDLRQLYGEYLKFFECTGWKEVQKKIIVFAFNYLIKDDKAFLEYMIAQDEHYQEYCNFMNKLTKKVVVSDFDFCSFRSSPIYNIEEGKYGVIYGYFLLEIIYKGMYFRLKELNELLPEGVKKKNFRGYYCDKFSECWLLYQVLETIYGKRYIKMRGQYIKDTFNVIGEPDYYIRNGNKIFLFESKDIFVSAGVKVSNDYGEIVTELQKRLYYEIKDNGRRANKAIFQLIENIKKLLSGNAEWDQNYKKKSIQIYPIIVLHDRMYNCPGMADLVKDWFRDELLKISHDYNIAQIENITIITIDSFILHTNYLQNPKNKLEQVIESYHHYIENSFKGCRNFDEMRNKVFDRLQSFDIYFSEFVDKSLNYQKLLTSACKELLSEREIEKIP